MKNYDQLTLEQRYEIQGFIARKFSKATGMVKIETLKSKTEGQVYKSTLRTLQEWRPWLHTITSDNGKEFAKHSQIAASLNIDLLCQALPFMAKGSRRKS